MMDEWQARYRALSAAITNPIYIENAERLVLAARHLAATSEQPFDVVFDAMYRMVIAQERIAAQRTLALMSDNAKYVS